MVSANVFNVATNDKVSGANGILNSKEKNKSVENSFDDVFGGYSKDVVAKQYNSKTDSNESVNKYRGQYSKAFYSSKAKRDKVSTEASNKIDDKSKLTKLKKLNDSIKDELKAKLGVTDEQLESVMEEMGLQYYDLLVPENLTKVVMAITGVDDPISLLNNAEFKDLFKQMADITNILSNELNMSVEEFYEMIGEMQTDMPTINEDLSENLQPGTVENVAEVNDVVKETGTDGKEAKGIESASGNSSESQAVDNNGLGQGIDTTKETSNQAGLGESNQSLNEDNSKNLDTTNNQEIAVNAFAEKVVQNLEFSDTVNNISQPVDTESILRQIQDSIRVNINGPDATMELQLNPESLGKVGISVVLKDGVMTAQISAQNEAVKEVIESQVAILREDMNSQGLKVEAIEVTIASHEFEQNLEENNDNSGDEYSKDGKPKGGLEVSTIDGSIDDMTEELSLEEKIMQENGNSMDVSA